MSAPDDPNDPKPLKDSTKAELILKAASRQDHAPPGVAPIAPKPAQEKPSFVHRPAAPAFTPAGMGQSSPVPRAPQADAAPKKTFAPLTQGGMRQRFGDAGSTEAQKKAAELKQAQQKKEFTPLAKNFSLSDEFNKQKI